MVIGVLVTFNMMQATTIIFTGCGTHPSAHFSVQLQRICKQAETLDPTMVRIYITEKLHVSDTGLSRRQKDGTASSV